MTQPAEPLPFPAWLATVENILYTETGLNLSDLPDKLFKDWHEDGLSPEDAYYRMLEEEYPGTETLDIFYQEFDVFSDADPGL